MFAAGGVVGEKNVSARCFQPQAHLFAPLAGENLIAELSVFFARADGRRDALLFLFPVPREDVRPEGERDFPVQAVFLQRIGLRLFSPQRLDQRIDGEPRRADRGAAAVKEAVVVFFEPADAFAALVHIERTVAVERQGGDELSAARHRVRLVKEVDAPVKRVQGGLLHPGGVPVFSREQEQPGAQSHPCDGDTGLLHRFFGVFRLADGRMVKLLVGAARAADQGNFGPTDGADKAQHRVKVQFVARDLVIRKHSLKKRHRFIRLRLRIEIRGRFVLQREVDQIAAAAAAGFDDVLCEREKARFGPSAVEVEHRLQYTARIDAAPEVRRLGDVHFPVFGADDRQKAVEVTRHRVEDRFDEGSVFADIAEMQHPGQHILAAPEVPPGAFRVAVVGRKPPVVVGTGEQIAHRAFQHSVKGFIVCAAVHEARAAHHLAPVFPAPAAVVCVRLRAERFDKVPPEGPVRQLVIGDPIEIRLFPRSRLKRPGGGERKLILYHGKTSFIGRYRNRARTRRAAARRSGKPRFPSGRDRSLLS